ncbi:hypothetical protein [Limihaloglobus sulfuriphilus]|nr:hypothetical protein [Limihaloglobus sulfuriphilus]
MTQMQAKELAFLFVYLSAVMFFLFCIGTNEICAESNSAEDSQTQLLTVAFDTASAIPVHPHIKDLCKTQAAVVEACIESGRIEMAERFADKIQNWRKAHCYAQIAAKLAADGRQKKADMLLAKARHALVDEKDGWRRELVTNLIDSVEKSKNNHIGSGPDTCGEFDIAKSKEWIAALEETSARGDFDLTMKALKRYVFLFERYYQQSEFRETVEKNIRKSWQKMPPSLRIDFLAAMVSAALDNHDNAAAVRLLDEYQAMVEGYNWSLEKFIPISAELLMLNYKAGRGNDVNEKINELVNLFDKGKDKILNIDRARTLRPLALACHQVGLSDKSLSLYNKVLDEGLSNLNSRPRAIDLAATCSSMAVNSIEPDDRLWVKINQIKQGLKEPW